jgi:hypothetical protein
MQDIKMFKFISLHTGTHGDTAEKLRQGDLAGLPV